MFAPTNTKNSEKPRKQPVSRFEHYARDRRCPVRTGQATYMPSWQEKNNIMEFWQTEANKGF